jgi:hypothetical protein
VPSSTTRRRTRRIPWRSMPGRDGVSQAQPQVKRLEAVCRHTVAYVCLSHAFPSFNTTTIARICRAESGSHWTFTSDTTSPTLEHGARTLPNY